MIAPPAVYTSLRLLSSVLLTAAILLMVAINTAALGEVRVRFISVSIYYHLWYVKTSLLPDEHMSYSPDGIVECRVMVVIAIIVAFSSLAVVLYGTWSHCCKAGITHRTNLLLYISLSLSILVVMLLVAFIAAFRYYLDNDVLDTTYSSSVASTSWKSGMHCAIAAADLCVASFTLDFIVLQMSPMMEKYAADAEARTRPENEFQHHSAYFPVLQSPFPAAGEPTGMPSQEQQAWSVQPAAPVFGQPLEHCRPGQGDKAGYGVNNSAPYQHISRSE